MEINTQYKNQEELYQRIVNQYGCDNQGNLCYKMEDTGTSFLLENVLLRKQQNILVTIELPDAIQRGATSQVNMMACLSNFGDSQRSHENDNNEDANYWDGLENMMQVLKRFTEVRDILYAPKYTGNFGCRSGYDDANVKLSWSEEGPEYVYIISTETEREIIHLVTDFRLVYGCPRNLHPHGKEKWQLSYLYRER